jgi:hypothetical protein
MQQAQDVKNFFDIQPLFDAGLDTYMVDSEPDCAKLRLLALQFMDDHGWPDVELRQFLVNLNCLAPEDKYFFERRRL